ncbi:SRA stem-loop interacting RNA binding protein, partial [Chelydra serpentina]
QLPFDKETGFHKGFCWVGFSSEEALCNALQKESHSLEGVKLQV